MKSLAMIFLFLLIGQSTYAGAVDECIDSIGRGNLKGCTVNAALESIKRCDQDPTVCSFNEICLYGYCRDKRRLAENEGTYANTLVWASRGSDADELIFRALPDEMAAKVQLARVECTVVGSLKICHREKEEENQ